MLVLLALHALAFTDYTSLDKPTGWFPGRVFVFAETPEAEAAARSAPARVEAVPFLYECKTADESPYHTFVRNPDFPALDRHIAVLTLDRITSLADFSRTFAEIVGNFTLDAGLEGIALDGIETVFHHYGRSRKAVRKVVRELGKWLHARDKKLFVLVPTQGVAFSRAEVGRVAAYVDRFVLEHFDYYDASHHLLQFSSPLAHINATLHDFSGGNPDVLAKMTVAISLAGFEHCDGERRPLNATEFGAMLPTLTESWDETTKEHLFTRPDGCVVSFPTPEYVTARLEFAQQLGLDVALFHLSFAHSRVFSLL